MKKLLFLMSLIWVTLSSCEKEEPVVTSIDLDKSELELKVGETYDFKVSHNPPDAKAPTYEWNVSQYYPLWGGGQGVDVARIDQLGHFEATDVGETYVTVMTTDIIDPVTGERFIRRCKVIIKPIEAEGLKLDKTEITIDPKKKEILTCTISPENATNKSLYWKTSNSNVVTVSPKGDNSNQCELTATGAGEAVITVALSNNSQLSATCKVKVNAAKLEGLSLSEKEKTVIQGESFKLTPVFTPEYATNKNVKWYSSDENIATVDSNGNVKTVHFGECVIKAKSEDGGFEAECKVVVKPIPLDGIKFEENYYSVEIGGKKQLKLQYFPDNAGNKRVKWSSSNTIVATVDENGVVKGNTRGNTTITAISEDGSHKAECHIRVVEIDAMMLVYFPSASVSIINGYYTGSISCAIRNNSSQTVKLTKFYVVDTGNYNIVAETTDVSLLGKELKPGETCALRGRFNSVYEPAFRWEFEYNGRTFSTYNRYGDSVSLKSSESIEPKGKSSNTIQLYKD